MMAANSEPSAGRERGDNQGDGGGGGTNKPSMWCRARGRGGRRYDEHEKPKQGDLCSRRRYTGCFSSKKIHKRRHEGQIKSRVSVMELLGRRHCTVNH